MAAFMVAVLAGLTVGGVWVGSAVIARHRAQAAADLAALAGAQRVPAGRTAACLGAEALAAAMGASMTGCEVYQLDIALAVQVRTGARFGGIAVATAKAGPAVATARGGN